MKYKSLLIRIPPDLHGELSPSRTPFGAGLLRISDTAPACARPRGAFAHAFCAPVLRISDAVRVWNNAEEA